MSFYLTTKSKEMTVYTKHTWYFVLHTHALLHTHTHTLVVHNGNPAFPDFKKRLVVNQEKGIRMGI